MIITLLGTHRLSLHPEFIQNIELTVVKIKSLYVLIDKEPTGNQGLVQWYILTFQDINVRVDSMSIKF